MSIQTAPILTFTHAYKKQHSLFFCSGALIYYCVCYMYLNGSTYLSLFELLDEFLELLLTAFSLHCAFLNLLFGLA